MATKQYEDHDNGLCVREDETSLWIDQWGTHDPFTKLEKRHVMHMEKIEDHRKLLEDVLAWSVRHHKQSRLVKPLVKLLLDELLVKENYEAWLELLK